MKFRGWQPGSSGNARCGSLVICLILILSLPGCLKKIPYQPEDLAAFARRPENVRLSFRTDSGRQVAFYIPPLKNPEKPPGRLAILFPGIESVALGWLRFIRLEEDPAAAFLLIDYPGRGLSEGFMRPEDNYHNSEGALAELAGHLGVPALDAEISLLGHSFGTGAALQFALRHHVKRIVLVAPFTTLTEAVALKSRLLAFFMPAEIDNTAQLKTLLARPDPPEIIIFHGSQDRSLPVRMGRELADIGPQRIRYVEIPGGGHSTILTTHRDQIFKTLLGLEGEEGKAN